MFYFIVCMFRAKRVSVIITLVTPKISEQYVYFWLQAGTEDGCVVLFDAGENSLQYLKTFEKQEGMFLKYLVLFKFFHFLMIEIFDWCSPLTFLRFKTRENQ